MTDGSPRTLISERRARGISTCGRSRGGGYLQRFMYRDDHPQRYASREQGWDRRPQRHPNPHRNAHRIQLALGVLQRHGISYGDKGRVILGNLHRLSHRNDIPHGHEGRIVWGNGQQRFPDRNHPTRTRRHGSMRSSLSLLGDLPVSGDLPCRALSSGSRSRA
jgi:hypothetical protein